MEFSRWSVIACEGGQAARGRRSVAADELVPAGGVGEDDTGCNLAARPARTVKLETWRAGIEAEQFSRGTIGQNGFDRVLELIDRGNRQEIGRWRDGGKILAEKKRRDGRVHIAAFELNRNTVFTVNYCKRIKSSAVFQIE